jgi:hypothetical protein
MPEATEPQELREHAEDARENPSMKPVSLTMAILAVLVASVALLGHRTHIEQVMAQSRANDQWAYYQAKNIRRHNYELFLDLSSIAATRDASQTEKLREKYIQQLDRYRDEQKDTQQEARKLEGEVVVAERKANRFNLGEVLLEIALVITSVTLLSGNRAYWFCGLISGATGVVVAATGLLVH